jgi:phytoene dehydrogenase-like protein
VSAQHVPFRRRGGWDAASTEALGEQVTRMLLTVAPDIRERTIHRWVLTPADLESRYGATQGSLSHGELALDQFLFMRPVPQCARYASPLAGFWLCGTGSHPGNSAGGGGWLMARELVASR